MHEKICIACFESYSINHTLVDIIAVDAQSRYNLRTLSKSQNRPAGPVILTKQKAFSKSFR